MLEIVKDWYEEVKKVSTEESNWGVETIILEKEELDVKLLPAGILGSLPDVLSISYYYYSYMDVYDIVYSLPLKDENQYVLGLLDKDTLVASTELKIESVEKSDDSGINNVDYQ
ncbi:hypothetical protein ACODJC_12450 [Vagococcus fluvialis]|uniref:hypothetical protein n=1 Tax=Vagococcus fluvialis TaxID=2738 RepID=UPI003B59A665